MFIIRLIFLVSALFFLLVLGLAATGIFLMRVHPRWTFLRNHDQQSRQNYHDDGKTIEGEYKVIDEAQHKD